MADTIAETVDLLYSISQDELTVDQQIALAQAHAALAQAERLDEINNRLYDLQQLLNTWVHRVTADGTPR